MENSGLRNGVFLGVALIIIYFIHYSISVQSVLSFATMTAFIAEIIFVLKAIREERKAQGGHITFNEGLKAGFLTFVLGVLIGPVFQWVLYNYIATDFVEQAKDVMDQSLDMMSAIVGDEGMEEMEEAMEKAAENLNYSLPTLLSGYLWKLIIPGILIALAGAAIYKKQRNEFA